MATRDRPEIDPDDMFSDTRMTFGEHIEDLRTHLIRALKGFLVAMVLSFWPLSFWVLDFITEPVRQEMTAYHKRRLAREEAKLLADPKKVAEGETVEHKLVGLKRLLEQLAPFVVLRQPIEKIPDDEMVVLEIHSNRFKEVLKHEQAKLEILFVTLTTLSVQEAVMVYIKVAMLTGFVLASPWIFFQIWSFIAAGLYPHEKRLVNVYLPFSLGLFLGGVLLCQFFVMPAAVRALLWFNELLDINPDLRLSEWLGFAIMLPLVFGLSFQTPVVMYFLFRVGLVELDTFREKRKLAWFLMAVFAAVITPTPDPVNMMLLWVPMGLLYELGIWLCKMAPPPEWEDTEMPEPEEPVEV
jgi:sec-independent protein translocase protein TatC